jgi:hypothetical protein
MSREASIAALTAVVERLNAAGDIWECAGEEIARIALRRWSSYERRHPKQKRVSDDHRILDLAKGLQSHFEPDTPFTPFSDWSRLAEALAEVLRERSGD